MDQELFNPQSSSVTSSRILYTPSTFARTSLLHLQEVGSLQAIHQHTSTRTNLTSFLCFVVLSGTGSLTYEGMTYELSAGDCVLIDCRKAYAAFIDEAVRFTVQEMRDGIVAEGLKDVDGKYMIESASVEFVGFIEDAYLCLQ